MVSEPTQAGMDVRPLPVQLLEMLVGDTATRVHTQAARQLNPSQEHSASAAHAVESSNTVQSVARRPITEDLRKSSWYAVMTPLGLVGGFHDAWTAW